MTLHCKVFRTLHAIFLLVGCLSLSACRPVAHTPACAVMLAPTPGPLAAERARAQRRPLRVVELLMQEGFQTSDAGFYLLAEQALQCAEDSGADALSVRRYRAELLEKFHRFAESAEIYAAIAAETDDAMDYADLGESLMNQGRLDEAAAAMQKAADRLSSPQIEGRIALLRWAWGDLDGAIEIAESATRDRDPVVKSWALALAGWFHALRGDPSPQLDQAVALAPDYATARFYRGLVRLHADDRAGAQQDLLLAGNTFDVLWARSELDPSVDPLTACESSARSCAVWLVNRDPERALALLDAELKLRQDAPTRVARAFVAQQARGEDPRAEVLAALDTGTLEPRALLQAGTMLLDRALLQRALDMGPGLLPSERLQAMSALSLITVDDRP